jgi:hypothetical protein
MDDREAERLTESPSQARLAGPRAPMTAIRLNDAAGRDELALR